MDLLHLPGKATHHVFDVPNEHQPVSHSTNDSEELRQFSLDLLLDLEF
jgi:hypothetical protein